MSRVAAVAAGIAGLGSCLLAYGFAVRPEQAAFSYLFAFSVVFTVAVGSLFLLMIGHASNAAWFVPLRRRCEVVVSTFPLVALCVVPVLASIRRLYPWTRPSALPAFERHPVLEKLSWLHERFFIGRSVVYVVVFVLFAELLCATSVAQDRAQTHSDAAHFRSRLVLLSVIGLLTSSIAITFASWDWIMSLEPAWYSDLFGVYVAAGGLLAALGLVGVMSVMAKRRGDLPPSVSADHFHALGRLDLAMVIFWAYMAFCHVLEHWIANLPVEQIWYRVRFSRGWQYEGLVLVLVHFVLPFFILLSRAVKRHPTSFAAISGWLIAVHCLDVHYLVAPSFHTAPALHWLDIVALVTLSAAAAAFGALRSRNLGPIPLKDPLLNKGLAYQSAS